MIIETWVALYFVMAVFVMLGISLLGWILSDKRCERSEKLNRKLVAENERLRRVISQINGIHNVEVATAFYNKEEKQNV